MMVKIIAICLFGIMKSYRIGRNPDNDIVFANREVSRYHAEIVENQDDYTLIDHSKNGTLVNGLYVHNTSFPIQLGYEILFGGKERLDWEQIVHKSPSEELQKTNPKENMASDSSQEKIDIYSTIMYYLNLDGETYGPFCLSELKTYPLHEDTLITTNTLNGKWYEAKYFECLDELFRPILPFKIDTDGVIIRENDEVSVTH